MMPACSTPTWGAPVADVELLVDGLHAGYGDLGILFGLDLVVGAGERVLLCGPNGSGKSTLLKAICGLADVTAGTVVCSSADITGWQPQRVVARGVSFVPQTDNVFPSLSIEENLQIGGVLARSLTRQRIQEIFELFPLLADRRSQRAGSLSGGERQLVAVGRALMLAPVLLMLDEPTAGLAPRTAEETLQHIVTVNEQRGTAILLVEQNVVQAASVTERFYLMETGRVRAAGEINELRSSPELARAYLGDVVVDGDPKPETHRDGDTRAR